MVGLWLAGVVFEEFRKRAMTLTDGAEAVDDNNRELDWVVADQAADHRLAAMDLEERAPIPVFADNASGGHQKNLPAAASGVVEGELALLTLLPL